MLLICTIFQYPWNDSEMNLFKAYIAYALNQYYTLKNDTTTFKSVLASI